MDLGFIDSTGMLELVHFIEQKYKVTLEDSDLIPENLDSIAQLARFIRARTSALPDAKPDPLVSLWQMLSKPAR
jgi:hypothetical protein